LTALPASAGNGETAFTKRSLVMQGLSQRHEADPAKRSLWQTVVIGVEGLGGKLAGEHENAAVLPDSVQVLEWAGRVSLVAMDVVNPVAVGVRRAKREHSAGPVTMLTSTLPASLPVRFVHVCRLVLKIALKIPTISVRHPNGLGRIGLRV
jgi:hypothetical protein